jgi:hypothetical protein
MALSILDGTQTATTLSTILSSGQHITAHTVVSLGTQAITDMRSAVSGSVVSIPSIPAISGTVTANTLTNLDWIYVAGSFTYTSDGDTTPTLYLNTYFKRTGKTEWSSFNYIAGEDKCTATITQGEVDAEGMWFLNVNYQAIFGFPPTAIGTLASYPLDAPNIYSEIPPKTGWSINTASGFSGSVSVSYEQPYVIPVSGTVTANPTGTQTIAGSVTLGASTAQIGSVTASISNSAVTVYPAQGASVTNSNFTSLTSSTSVVSAVAGREVLTVFNEGAGNLHISPGATCTTISYQVRLSAGDYWECPAGQLSLAHTAVFATAGTARITQVS